MPKGSALATATVVCVVLFSIWHSAFGINRTRDQLYEVILAEDARAPHAADLQRLVDATRNPDATLRRIAVRALGRLERAALIVHIEPLIAALEPAVRAAAANALGQALFGAPPDRTRDSRRRVAGLLSDRLKAERDPDVRGTVARTLGRLDYESEEEVRRAESIIAGSLAGPPAELEGALRGLEHLFRVRSGKVPPTSATLERLREAVVKGSPAAIRRLAVLTLRVAGALDPATAEKAFRDTDWQVRRLVVAGGHSLLEALNDPSPHVRFEVARALGSMPLPPALCAARLRAARDTDPRVARQAVARLGMPCDDGHMMTEEIALVAGLARRRGDASPVRWQIAAAALGALANACGRHHAAAADCAGTAGLVRDHASDPVWEVRMYAAAAARAMGDLSVVRRLARDDHPNVRSAAIEALSESGLLAEDRPLVLDALRSHDYQLVRAAARAIAGTREAADIGALSDAFERLSARQSDTAHDSLIEIRDALRPAGVELLVPGPAPHRAPFTRAEFDRLASREHRASVTMQSGGTFELTLLADDAPATCARFIRLVRQRAYDGRTFHRVEPNFVIQGGSPGANEYAGSDPYLRDEVGLISHARGTVGISTRGRDTGDAQIFVNLADNPRLDHRYTVFARVAHGMDVIDRILEGDVIARIVIR